MPALAVTETIRPQALWHLITWLPVVTYNGSVSEVKSFLTNDLTGIFEGTSLLIVLGSLLTTSISYLVMQRATDEAWMVTVCIQISNWARLS